jgi:hypothetical protein
MMPIVNSVYEHVSCEEQVSVGKGQPADIQESAQVRASIDAGCLDSLERRQRSIDADSQMSRDLQCLRFLRWSRPGNLSGERGVDANDACDVDGRWRVRLDLSMKQYKQA